VVYSTTQLYPQGFTPREYIGDRDYELTLGARGRLSGYRLPVFLVLRVGGVDRRALHPKGPAPSNILEDANKAADMAIMLEQNTRFLPDFVVAQRVCA
jgi:hypothetical protein